MHEKTMKEEEVVALKYLESNGYTDIIYEPDGNIPPDFLVDDNIAIEVRRLNQHFHNGEIFEPLEKLKNRLIPKLVKIIGSIDVQNYSNSVAVSIKFSRPISVNKSLFASVKHFLQEHVENFQHDTQYFLNENLSIRLFKLSKRFETYYCYGSSSDFDGGGLVIKELHEGLKIAIIEKEQKVMKYVQKYNKWWLILIDHIAYNVDFIDINQIQELPIIDTSFEKVIIVSPWADNASFEYK
jgi:hypothetical protein